MISCSRQHGHIVKALAAGALLHKTRSPTSDAAHSLHSRLQRSAHAASRQTPVTSLQVFTAQQSLMHTRLCKIHEQNTALPHTRDVQFRRSARSSASCSTAVPWCGRSHSQEHRLKTSSENSARVHRSSVQARSQIQGVLRGSPCCIRLKHMELLLNLCRWICVLSSGMAGQHRHSCA